MKKKVKMADIAKKLDVSVVTVSKALANKDGVSPEMRGRIKALAIDMGYSSKASRSSQNDEPRDIGILIAQTFVNSKDAFYWEIYEKVVSRLQANDYYAVLEIVTPEDKANLTPPRIIRRVCGLIVIGSFSDDYLTVLHLSKTPIVYLDSYNHKNYQDAVISDGYYGMYSITNYLISMGHRKISFLGTLGATSSINDRYFGFLRAMEEHGISVTDEMRMDDRNENGVIEFHLPEHLPTAFACNCDITAYTLIQMLKERGLHVPKDVSVTGFDNCNVSSLSDPAITTYAVDKDGMVFACVKKLLDKMTNQRSENHINVIVGKMEIKKSVAEYRAYPAPDTDGPPTCSPL
ncbi:MAG: LacI family DNA-binding transcriptional regulator [Clostridium sp.]|jgi:DNA-binding LacI/PurR family transcriptional regulator|nr:LacI family DNA-binding transcriptional regulator [Clostridium sp.]